LLKVAEVQTILYGVRIDTSVKHRES